MLKEGLYKDINIAMFLADNNKYIFRFEGDFWACEGELTDTSTKDDVINVYSKLAETDRVPIKIIDVLSIDHENNDYYTHAKFETTTPMTPTEFIKLYRDYIDDDVNELLVETGFEIVEMCTN